MMRIAIIHQASKNCSDLIREKFLKSWNISLADMLSLILLNVQILRRGSGL